MVYLIEHLWEVKENSVYLGTPVEDGIKVISEGEELSFKGK